MADEANSKFNALQTNYREQANLEAKLRTMGSTTSNPVYSGSAATARSHAVEHGKGLLRCHELLQGTPPARGSWEERGRAEVLVAHIGPPGLRGTQDTKVSKCRQPLKTHPIATEADVPTGAVQAPRDYPVPGSRNRLQTSTRRFHAYFRTHGFYLKAGRMPITRFGRQMARE